MAKKGEPMHPNSLASLRQHQFQKGRSGNPGGKRKSRPIEDEYRKGLRERLNKTKIGQEVAEKLGCRENDTWARAIALGQLRMAVTDPRSAREVREPTEGKPLTQIREVDPETGALQPQEIAQNEHDARSAIDSIVARIRARRSDPSGTAGNSGSTLPN